MSELQKVLDSLNAYEKNLFGELERVKAELGDLSTGKILEMFDDGDISEEERNRLIEKSRNLEKKAMEISISLKDVREQKHNIEQAIVNEKPKKLGGWHIVISYIWLPLTCFMYLIALFSHVVECFSEPLGANIPYLIAYAFTGIVGIFTFISMIQQNQKAYYLIHIFCVSLLYSNLVDYIANLMTLENILYTVPLNAIITAIIFMLIHKYYKNRQDLLDSPRVGSLIRNSNTIIPGIIFFIGMIALPLGIYGDSVYYMFQKSVGYGLFGVFVPVISQFVFLLDTGLVSIYAFNFYFTALSLAFAFVISGITELLDPS